MGIKQQLRIDSVSRALEYYVNIPSLGNWVPTHVAPVASTGSSVLLDTTRNYGETTPLTVFTVDTTGATREAVGTVFAKGFSARPAPLNDVKFKIMEEPATYDPAKELMVTLRYISTTKILCTIKQY
jgi:hypothetical protein